MVIIETKKALQEEVNKLKSLGKSIGFAPTMGALHKGHLSLIETSNKTCNITVCSIFINPTQFNDKEDYNKYPRTFDKDIKMLDASNCDIIFMPSREEMYPEPDNRTFDFGYLGEVMEGTHRPGHFNGVAQIVSKLFDAVPADKAFFGQKDFQQLAIIKEMTKQLGYKIDVVACPIVREESGLAMSSRNQRLSESEKIVAANIFRILNWAKENYLDFTVSELKEQVVKEFKEVDALDLEYFELVDHLSLKDINAWSENTKFVACVAVFCGKVRLIDNIVFNL